MCCPLNIFADRTFFRTFSHLISERNKCSHEALVLSHKETVQADQYLVLNKVKFVPAAGLTGGQWITKVKFILLSVKNLRQSIQQQFDTNVKVRGSSFVNYAYL